MVRSKSLVCVLAILIAGVHAGAQQITGSIRGTVQDPSSALVQGASVSARQIETGLTRTANTDAGGAYVLVELPVGHYELQVEAKGFQKYVQQGITLNVNETATVPVHLAVGAESQVLEVNADAQLIQGTVTSLGKTVTEREVLDLPLNGRNFTQLGLLQPGVVPLTPGLSEAGGSLRAGQSYAVNGQRPESNNFLIDGANNFNGVDGGFVLKPPVDAITEFRILTHNASAEFGNALGSTTNIITRSGSNRFHGRPFSSHITRAFTTAREKRNLQLCLPWPSGKVISRPSALKASLRVFAIIRTTSYSTSSSASPTSTTSTRWIPKPIPSRRIS